MKIVIIGAGTMATVHSEAYQQMNHVDLAGIVDIRLDSATNLANLRETRAYKTLEEAIAKENPDVIDICVPTYLHYEFAKKAAYAKKNVICEKPLTRTLEQARAIIDICIEEGVQLFVGHVVRFFPEYGLAKELVQSGQIGKVGTVRTMRGGAFPNATEDWYASLEKSGGLIVDLIIHDFDYLRSIFGEVDHVFTKALTGRKANRIDHAFVSIRFKNGVIAEVEGSWAEPSGFHTEFEFCGTAGVLKHDSRNETPIHLSLRAQEGTKAGVQVPESPLTHSPYYTELEHFIHCIETNRDPIVTPEDAYKALEISLMAVESLRTGQPVFCKEEA
jgi:UDP-N-acetylglucosamine 3-dehydrogenase